MNKWIEKMSKTQALTLAFVCYLGFTASTFGFPIVKIEAAVIAVWNDVFKTFDLKQKFHGDKKFNPDNFVNLKFK